MRGRWIGAAIAVLLAGGAGAAEAAPAQRYEYSGVLASGFDRTGVFGVAGRNLKGLPFLATFLREDADGAEISIGPLASSIAGEGAAAPLRAWLTIGGMQRSVGADQGAQVQGLICEPDCEAEYFRHDVHYHSEVHEPGFAELSDGFLEVFGETTGLILPSADYHDLPSLGPGDPVAFTGEFQFTYQLWVEDVLVFEEDVRGTLAPTALRVLPFDYEGEPSAPVPEPGAWALMILGFGSAGSMLRIRRGRLACA